MPFVERPRTLLAALAAAVIGADERLVSISAGRRSACGLRAGGSVLCWTDDRQDHPKAVSEVPPDGPFT